VEKLQIGFTTGILMGGAREGKYSEFFQKGTLSGTSTKSL
jgi:hypothetical protein